MVTILLLCVTGGEPLIGLPEILAYPFYDPKLGQLFPFRTASMIISLLSHVIVSTCSRWLFANQWLSASWDVLRCFHGSKCTSNLSPSSNCRSIPTIAQHVDRRKMDISDCQLNFKMGRIPRPKLRRHSAHGIYRREIIPGFVQRETRDY